MEGLQQNVKSNESARATAERALRKRFFQIGLIVLQEAIMSRARWTSAMAATALVTIFLLLGLVNVTLAHLALRPFAQRHLRKETLLHFLMDAPTRLDPWALLHSLT